ncbi:hypothetical protein NMG60_11030450 [Bertholletia excelsa]
MASKGQNQEGDPANLRKQLAVAIRSIQWSYAIFWSISSAQPGVLEWGDGYYNGNIKTRKTVQAVEFNSNELELKRSDQLRELYMSLSAGESSSQTRRPSAALSPEDLTDTEWYYLVCMSFVFDIGQGLPGRTLANGKPIWLCNAHYADTRTFSRSLLAKSASIQTVVCFPYSGGVIELGVTELVLEDPNLIQHIKTSFLEIPSTNISMMSRPEDIVYAELENDILGTDFNPLIGCEEENVFSPTNSSNRIVLSQQFDEASQMQSWQLMDDEVISNCVQNSMSSSDCISQAIMKGEKEKKENQMNPTILGFQDDGVYYQSVLSTLLKSSHQLILGPHFQKSKNRSSFVSWKKGDLMGSNQIPRTNIPQRLLKKVLFEVAQMHLPDLREDSCEREGILWGAEVGDNDLNHELAERMRREKISERFSILGSLVPSPNKVDKVSILDKTIEHIKELRKRVDELESCKDARKLEERTSDNCGNYSIGNRKKPLMNKRKACDVEEMEAEISRVLLKDTSTPESLNVNVINKNVLVEIRCPWREYLLLEVMDAISHLHMDSHSVQSTNVDGMLSLTIKSKFKGSTVVSAGVVRQAIERVMQKVGVFFQE